MRILKQLAIAIGVAVVVFVIVIVTAWFNLRAEPRICLRQWVTQQSLPHLASELEEYIPEYRREHGKLPDRLADLPEFSPDVERAYLKQSAMDEWKNPIHYEVAGDKFVVMSLGRGGVTGGVGPDADLYSEERNRNALSPSFLQFVTEYDPHEIATGGFFFDGLVTAGIVACTVFVKLLVHSKHREKMKLRDTIIGIVVIVALTVAVGIFLLPVHIPNGH